MEVPHTLQSQQTVESSGPTLVALGVKLPFVVGIWCRLRRHATPWLVVETTLLLAMSLFILLHHVCINLDSAGYVQAGQMLLEGQVPYVDFYDINPPWVMYVHVLPALASQWLAISPTLAFALFILLLLVLL